MEGKCAFSLFVAPLAAGEAGVVDVFGLFVVIVAAMTSATVALQTIT